MSIRGREIGLSRSVGVLRYQCKLEWLPMRMVTIQSLKGGDMKNFLSRMAILGLLVAYAFTFESERLSNPRVATVALLFVAYCLGYEIYRLWKFLNKP